MLDEPVSALDVSIRAQMMNLLKDIQAQDNVAYLLVAHDLATVRHMADHTVVMYLGKIVEQAPTASLFEDVRHPYTKALFSAVLVAVAGAGGEEEVELSGEVPSPLDPPSGCRFHTRCPYVMPHCSQGSRRCARSRPATSSPVTCSNRRTASMSKPPLFAWGPLQGVKVVSCSTAQAGTVPYMLMADLGADVIKIETPDGGDGSRRMTVLPGKGSTFFETNNRGVKSVTLNLKTPEGRAILHKLVAKADIFGQNFRPGAAEKNGFGYEELRKINPKLVYVSISGYGTKGPNGHLPGTDSMAQALGGIAEAYSMPGQKMRTGIASVADESDRHAGLRRRARGADPCAHHRASARRSSCRCSARWSG